MKQDTYQTKTQNETEIDQETGEIVARRTTRIIEQVDEYRDVKLPKKHKFDNGNFITLFQEAVLKFSMNENLSRTEMRVLFYLIGTAGIGGSINITNAYIAKDLNIKIPHISTSINSLVGKNIIIKKKDFGLYTSNDKGERTREKVMNISLNFDRFNYNFAYNGRIKDYKQIQHKDPEILIEKKTDNQPKLF
jgi:DNA-binding MarR family transcriptional regulator